MLTGIVGESGSGKTMTALSIMGLLPKNLKLVAGDILFYRENNSPVSLLSQNELRKIRGKEIAMIFQEPMSSLNPRIKVKDMLLEARKLHFPNETKTERLNQIKQLILNTGINLTAFEKFPHEFSGGRDKDWGLPGHWLGNRNFRFSMKPFQPLTFQYRLKF